MVLLEKYGQKTLHFRRIKAIACEVFKSINDLNPTFMKEYMIPKEVPYDFRDDNKLVLPHFNTLTYGRNTFKYYGPHIWNILPANYKLATDMNAFKRLLKTWEGPRCQCNLCDVM